MSAVEEAKEMSLESAWDELVLGEAKQVASEKAENVAVGDFLVDAA